MWIASRTLTDPAGKAVEVSIAAPVDAGDCWECPVRFVRDGVESLKDSHGNDAFEALANALTMIQQEVRGCTLHPSIPGWSGFPKIVGGDPHTMDLPRLHDVIDAEVDRQTREYRAKNGLP